MSEGGTERLRIYCICGQKMKVIEDMYGLPGKCVACRQKMRIPRRDEVPEGITEIHLKDHPEFLRESKRPPTGETSEEDRPAIEGPEPEKSPMILDEETRRAKRARRKTVEVSIAPLDILSPLRNLCSIQYKLGRQLEALGESNDTDRAEIEAHLQRFQRVRADLDEQNRQVLMEVAIELAATQEKSAEECLAARVGERTFDEFSENIDRLRRRRDRLERRQRNLQGWLAITGPHLAGGFIDLPIESAVEDGFSISIPSEADESESLLDSHTTTLRDALRQRAQAKLKLAELDHVPRDGPRGLREARADCVAEKQIADATIAFARERLDQLRKDYASDMETARAQLDLARSRMRTGEIDRAQFDSLETQLLKANTEAAKAKNLVNRALSANTEQDVPHPKDATTERLPSGREGAAIATDAWIAWGAALLLGISIFIPTAGNLSLVSAFLEFSDSESPTRWAFFWPLIMGIVVALTAALPERTLRGRLMALVWFLGTLLGAHIIHQAQFGIDPVSARFRTGLPWLIRPGILTLLLADLGVLVAVVLAIPRNQVRVWLPAGLALALIALAAIFTDGAGRYLPKPAVAVSLSGPDEQESTVAITNKGHRIMVLVDHSSDARAAYLYVLERRIGPNSWSEVPGHALPRVSSLDPLKGPQRIAPGEIARVTAALAPGDYRVLLISKARDEEWPITFTIEEPLPQFDNTTPQQDIVERTAQTPDKEPLPEVELRGIMAPGGGKPRFSFILYFSDGRESEGMYSIGENLFGYWDIAEYNRTLNTVTLMDGNTFLILRRGERTPLTE